MGVLGEKMARFSASFPRATIAYAALCVAAVIVLIGSALVGG